jgi:hypothetical protein
MNIPFFNSFRQRQGPLAVLLVLLLVWAPAACQRSSQQSDQAPEIDVSLETLPSPPAVGPAQLLVTVTEDTGQPVDGATVELQGDMAHAGMVPVQATASGQGAGLYSAEFQWTMGGDWFVTVTVTLPDGRTTSRRFDVTVGGDTMD